MIVKDEGHVYELQNLESDSFQVLQFVKKQPVSEGSSQLETVIVGTTNEEVLKVLIHRLTNLNTKFPCRENSIVITKLEESLMWLEKRTVDRKARGVEGTHIK